ncbi:DUF2530 domain-containing protein [Pseudonocardia parietis]|uniref:DUF2530 domain-containing protein n=1 Tax=Pseudonocardia parietis TaxID=570936 RepID=A0ABS4W4U7_9PSEU|nr:DUF2530 domain-containing protein [Pseudonocardia parietis]MBP2371170.1 hypothetical protein [Pseudonocardia parietis]
MTAPGPDDPPPPPPLRPRFYEAPPVIVGGMLLWAAAAGIALLVAVLNGNPPGELFWTCVAGTGVGLLGALLFTAQRAAARRGDRSAQRGVEPGRRLS